MRLFGREKIENLVETKYVHILEEKNNFFEKGNKLNTSIINIAIIGKTL